MIGSTSYRGQSPITLMRAVQTGRTTVPVRPAYAPFARYKHVVGRPASMGGQSVPLLKLKVLDNLIDYLIGMKSRTAEMLVKENQKREGPGPELREEQVDAMIGQLHRELRSAVTASGNTTPTGIETGNVVNVLI